MQFLKISESTTLSQLTSQVGSRNVDHVLSLNDISRSPYVGKALYTKTAQISASSTSVSVERKIAILNTFTQDSDIFEAAALLSDSSWKVMSALGTFNDMLRIPESIQLPDSTDILGNSVAIGRTVYEKVMNSLKATNTVDPGIFTKYTSTQAAKILNSSSNQPKEAMEWFKLPWGDITLHSSLDDTSIEFPVYPEELSDNRQASYTTMPDILFQYEPWQIYQSSGPRTNTYTFKFHRDMWTGDHRDGKANELIRFCEALCYPEYDGSAVNTSTATLYIAGSPLISGIVTDVTPHWSGPIGLDGFYLVCELSITITEVSKTALNYSVVKQKGLIG